MAIVSANGTRWVIQGAVSICPASIRPMIRRKSRERALRLARIESSRRCITGAWGNDTSACVIPTNTIRPPKAPYASAPPMLALEPVASTTTSQNRPSVSSRTASRSEAAPVARSVSATPIRSRTNASRAATRSMTITRAPESFANSTAESPIGPAPMTSTVSEAVGAPRSMAWQPMASVSTSAFCSCASFGERWSFRAGTVNSGRRPPSQWTPSV